MAKRVDFVAPPFAGHLNPILGLAMAAQEAGYVVRVITGQKKLPAVESVGLRGVSLPSLQGQVLESIANPDARVGSNPLQLLGQLRQSLGVLPAIKNDLKTFWQDERPDIVVADSVAPVAGLACEQLGIPWVTTTVTSCAIESDSGVPSYCGGWVYRPDWLGSFRDAAGRGAVRLFKRTVSHLVRKELAELGLHSLYREDGSERIYSPLAIFGLGIDELEFPRRWPAAFTMIGPVLTSPGAVPTLPRTSTGPSILVTLGTHLLWAKQRLAEQIVALSALVPEAEFVVTTGDPEAPTTAAQVAPRVTVVPFVNYEFQLAEFDAVVHHGGAGICHAAIWHGLPSLVVPHDYDQFDYAARMVHFDLGERVNSLAAGQAGPALRRILLRKEWPSLTRMQQAARGYRPQQLFLRRLDGMLR